MAKKRPAKKKTARRKPASAARGDAKSGRAGSAKGKPASARPGRAGVPGRATSTPKPGTGKSTARGGNSRAPRPPLTATSHDPIQFPEDGAALPRSPLTGRQLDEFRQMLLMKRAELVGDVRQLTAEVLNRRSDGSSDHSSMPIHMADVGSDNWEQELTLGLIASERVIVREVENALERIEDGTYGVCLATHQPIPVARLRAKPWARYTIEYERLRDEGRAP